MITTAGIRLDLVGLALALVALCAPRAAAQGTATVRGRVIERQTQAPVAGITVSLNGRAPAVTGRDGSFRFARVPPGRYVLAAEGIGYAASDSTLLIAGDTTVVLALERTPVQLDTVAVRAHNITIRGTVVEKASGTGLIDVDVVATPDRHAVTDPIGRFKFGKVPAAVPITIQAREFGYAPLTMSFTTERDTILRFELEPDPVVAGMVARQKHRIVERAGERQYKFDGGVIDRAELMQDLNGSVRDVLNRVLGSRMERVRCFIIDEKPMLLAGGVTSSGIYNGRRLVARRSNPLLDTLLPDRVEYIDVLQDGSTRPDLMVRIFTREFVQRMTAGGDTLVSLDRILEGRHVNQCR